MGLLVITVALLAFAVATCRRPAPVRMRRDVLRIVVSVVAILVMARITGVSTPAGLVALAIGGGLLLGALQGWNTKVLKQDGKVLAAKAPAGVAAWGMGVLVMQGAGIASRTGALQLGQGISWLGASVLAGTIVGRSNRLQRDATGRSESPAKSAAALLLVFAVAGALAGGVVAAPAAGAEGGRWVLQEVETDPDGQGQILNLVAVQAGPAIISFDVEDAPFASLVGIYEEPPAELVPGEEYRLAVEVSAQLTGGTDVQGYRQMDVIFIYNEVWDNQAVGAGVSCTDPVGAAPISCTEPMTSFGEFSFVAPPVTAEATFTVGVGALNCGGQCYTRYTYQAEVEPEPGPVAEPEPEPELVPEPEPVPQPEPEPEPETADQDNSLVAPPVPLPAGDADRDDISSVAAAGQVLGGLLAAAAIGLISVGDATVLISSLVGRGPYSPGEAIAISTRIFDAAPPGALTPAAPHAAGPSPPPMTRPATIYIEGADAEAVLAGGPGSTVAIPGDQQWDVNVSVEGEPPVTEGRVGSVGVVRSVGPVVRGPNGRISIAVEVDAFDPPPPPRIDETPPIDLEPVTGPEPELPEPLPPRLPPMDETPPIDLEPVTGPEPELPEPLPPRLP
ncbi:MAG TPA: hypothetical protein VLL51_07505, partial [Gemmatimonadales bacterium]|nr:hypothetical protein [Gemmatimonadales bacterium]